MSVYSVIHIAQHNLKQLSFNFSRQQFISFSVIRGHDVIPEDLCSESEVIIINFQLSCYATGWETGYSMATDVFVDFVEFCIITCVVWAGHIRVHISNFWEYAKLLIICGCFIIRRVW